MLRLTHRLGEVQMGGDTKVRTTDDYERYDVLRVDVVHDVDLVQIDEFGFWFALLVLLVCVGQTAVAVVLHEVNIIEHQTGYR